MNPSTEVRREYMLRMNYLSSYTHDTGISSRTEAGTTLLFSSSSDTDKINHVFRQTRANRSTADNISNNHPLQVSSRLPALPWKPASAPQHRPSGDHVRKPQKLLLLSGDEVHSGVLQQGGEHEQQTHRHPDVYGLHVGNLERTQQINILIHV